MNLTTLLEEDLEARDGANMSLLEGPQFQSELVTPAGMSYLLQRAADDPRDIGLHFIRDNGDEEFVSYKQLLGRARRRAAALIARNLHAGDRVVFLLRDSAEFIVSLWGAIFAGIVPVPLAYPSNFSEGNSAMVKLKRVSALLCKPTILSDAQAVANRETILGIIGDGCVLLDAAELADEGEGIEPRQPESADDIVFIQFSSGSTGDPKGVTLSHRNIIYNLESMIRGGAMTAEDKMLSWMPYYHDMGIMGFHLVPLALPCTQINMTPFRFVRRPASWLEQVSVRRATITGSPNFGYKYLLEKTSDETRRGWDLSCLKMIFNGAEPISMEVMTDFMRQLSCCGLAAEAMCPVYGMAEATLGVTLQLRDELPRVHSVQRKLLVRDRIVRHCAASDGDALRAVEVGSPVPGTSLRIVNDADELVPVGTVGHVQIMGDNVTRGYWENPAANQATFCEGWLRTGDLGFVLDGRVSITGRAKDVIFVRGQNFFAYDLEQTISDSLGIAQSRLAAVGFHDEKAGQECVALFIEKRRASDAVDDAGYRRIWQLVSDVFGIPLDFIVSVKTIPKTTSGKVCRYLLAEDLRAGVFADDAHTAATIFGVQGLALAVDRDTPTEALVRRLWVEVLANESLATLPKDVGFRAVGGSSVKAIQLLERLESTLHRIFPQELLLGASTIEQLAAALDSAMKKSESSPPNLRTAAASATSEDDVAIIGLHGVMPTAGDMHQYWQALLEGRSATRDLSEVERFRHHAWQPGRYWASLAEGMEEFDAKFFRISEQEARVMDPQQRVFLQLSWHLLESAGYGRERRDGAAIGVFVGASYNAHFEHQLNSLVRQSAESFSCWSGHEAVKDALFAEWDATFGAPGSHANMAADNLLNMIAARTSHELNLKGPALAVDTACSSSLVALHLACASIRRGECQLAIAGGVNLLATASILHVFERAGLLSKCGQSETFGLSADGLVPGEGAGAVLLKPLSHARRDGDCIWAVVRGSAINNDGASLGVMAPNPDGQREVIARAYQQAGVSPDSIQYIEAHATGTPVGDPSEVRALRQVFGDRPRAVPRAVIGSVKRNVGHLLSAAGMASLLKVLLAMREGVLPPSGGTATPIAGLSQEDSPFELLAEARPWQLSEGGLRRAAVNSFGFGGTNCHLILETAPASEAADSVRDAPQPAPPAPGHLLCLSAPSAQGLSSRRQQLADFLSIRPGADLASVCRTEMVHRSQFEQRWATWIETPAQATDKLRDLSLPGNSASAKAQLAFLFTGQGSQRAGAGAELYARDARFRRHFDQVAEACSAVLARDLREIAFDAEQSELLAETEFTQPAVFCVSYALARVLQDSGVEPSLVLGHSVGEYVAATLAGVLSATDAAWLVARRGLIMREHGAPGRMLALFCDEQRLGRLLLPPADGSVPDEQAGRAHVGLSEVWLAGSNGAHVVAAGSAQGIEELARVADTAGIRSKKISVSRPFHTPLMADCRPAFSADLARISLSPPKLPMLSNLTGESIGERVTQPEYWVEHALSPVRFADNVRVAAKLGISAFVELGPASTLAGTTRAILLNVDSPAEVVAIFGKKRSEPEALGNALGRLYELGALNRLDRIDPSPSTTRIALASSPLSPEKIPSVVRSAATAQSRVSAEERERTQARKWCSRWQWSPAEPAIERPMPPGAILLVGEVEATRCLAQALESSNNPVLCLSVADLALVATDAAAARTLALGVAPSRVAAVIGVSGLHAEAQSDETAIVEHFLASYRIALSLAERGSNPRLLVLTRAALSIEGSAALLDPAPVIACALALAAAEESPELSCLALDVAPDASAEQIAEIVARELGLAVDREHVTAWRQGARLVRRLVPLEQAADDGGFRLCDGHTVLISGGAGGVGAALAGALAARVKLNLVLVGRTPLDLSSASPPSLSLRVQGIRDLLQRLTALGACVAYEVADVCDATEVEALVARCVERFGSLDGVIHAAGVVDTETISLRSKTSASMARVLAPKVSGARHLVAATAHLPLQFFVAFGSAAATRALWAHGLGDYSAANAFLDELCERQSHARPNTRWLAINWPLWRECGMATIPGVSPAARARGLAELDAEQATGVFRVLLEQAQGVVHVGCTEARPAESRERMTFALAAPVPVDAPSPRAKAGERGALRLSIEQAIRSAIVKRVGCALADVGLDTRFSDLGLNSDDALAVAAELSRAFECVVAPTVMFEFQTVAELTSYVLSVAASHFERAGHGSPSSGEHAADRRHSPAPETETEQPRNRDDIAVVGMACLIPGANGVSEFAELLERGQSVIREVPAERFAGSRYYDAKPDPAKTYSKWGAFLDRPYDFEPAFFGISPHEALAMDPQQRLFLEVAWGALSNAGYAEHRPRKVGVFVGCEANHYAERFLSGQRYEALLQELESSGWHARLSEPEQVELRKALRSVLEPAKLSADAVAGNGLNEIAARVSHCLDLSGPAITVNTACSSTLVALHWACEALRRGEAELSLVGGVYVAGNATPFIMLSQLQALSPDGRSVPFDAAANGMVLGEGASALLLKPLTLALRDGDPIHAVIRGSAVNNDGHSRGITAPNPAGQAEAVRMAYAGAGVRPEEVGYIEAHGTGTALGDPIEIDGLQRVFGSVTAHPIAIGSVKGTIGHLLAASGGPSLIKAIVSVREGKVFPSVGYSRQNPLLPLAGTSLHIAAGGVQPWPMPGKRMAGVNSFGFGGTNCHVIIEQPPERAVHPEPASRSGALLVSGRTPNARAAIARRTLERLQAEPASLLLDLVMSTNRSLRQFPHRLAIAFRDREELLSQLTAYLDDERTPLVSSGRAPFRHGIHWRFELAEWRPESGQIQELCRAFSVFDQAYRAWGEHFASSAAASHSERERGWVAAECALAALLSAAGLTPSEVFATGFARVCAEALGSRINPTITRLEQDPEPSLNQAFVSRGPLWSEAQGWEDGGSESIRVGDSQPVLVLTPLDATHTSSPPEPLTLDSVDVRGLLDLVVRAFSLGARIDSRALFSGNAAQISVAPYPFERETYQVGMSDADFEPRRASATEPQPPAITSVRSVPAVAAPPGLNEAQRARLSRVLRDTLGGSNG